jgi:ubiquinone/menaquinone biosynthesis C-methylase UbiE
MPSHFDLLAPFYDRVLGTPEIGALRELLPLPTAGRILELGGGTGRKASLLGAQGARMLVADLSFAMLKAGRRRGGLDLVQCRAERLPFAADCFAAVLVVDALHHFQNQSEALHQTLRVLRPGGRLLIEEPDIGKTSAKMIALGEKLLMMRSRFLSAEEISSWISRQGLRPVVDRREGISVRIAVDK